MGRGKGFGGGAAGLWRGGGGGGRKSGARAPPPWRGCPSVRPSNGGVTPRQARRREDGFGVGVGLGRCGGRRKGDLKAWTLIGGDEAPRCPCGDIHLLIFFLALNKTPGQESDGHRVS